MDHTFLEIYFYYGIFKKLRQIKDVLDCLAKFNS